MIGKLKLYAAAALAFLLAVVTFGQAQKRKGRNVERDKQERIDNETANDIRKRADAVERVPDDKLKFRD